MGGPAEITHSVVEYRCSNRIHQSDAVLASPLGLARKNQTLRYVLMLHSSSLQRQCRLETRGTKC